MESLEKTKTKHYLNKTALYGLYIVLFIDAMGIGILFPLLTKTLVDVHSHALVYNVTTFGRNVLYGAILAIYFITWFFGAAMLGDLSDSIGRKKALLICMAGVAIAYLMTAFAFIWHSLWLVIIGRIFAGLTAGSQPIAQAAITDVSPPENLTRNLGFILFFFTMGLVIGPICGGVLSDSHLVSWFSNTTPLYVITFLSIVNFFLILFAFQETSLQNKKIKIKFKKAIMVFVSAFQHETVKPLSIAFTFILMGFNGYYFYVSVFLLRRFNFSASTIGIYLALVGVGLAIGTAILPGWFEKHRFKAEKVVFYGNLVLTLGIFLTNILENITLVWLIVIPMNAAYTVAYSYMLSLFSKQVDQEKQGWIMGITGAILAFSNTMVTIINGFMTNLGNQIPLLFSTILLVVGLLLFGRLKLK